MNSKAAQERQQRILLDLVRQPGNDVCADCKGRAPRWASWNLGIFICVQCAGVHRKMGVHISKVKSITLDTWTREQVDKMKEIGNIKSNRLYNPDEMRNRPPTNMEESERDSELEKYIRRKYEFRRFMEGKPPPVPTKDATFLRSPPTTSSGRSSGDRQVSAQIVSSMRAKDQAVNGNGIARSRTAPIPSSWSEAQEMAKSKAPPLPTSTLRSNAPISSTLAVPGSSLLPRSSSSAANPASSSQLATTSTSTRTASANSSVFDDLISLSTPAAPSAPQPALQMNPWASLQAQQQNVLSAPAIQEPSGNFWAGSNSNNSVGTSPLPSPSSPFGAASSAQQLGSSAPMRLPQHANTLPSFSLASPSGMMQQQQAGMLSPGNGSMFPQYQQQRSASLGTMAFSTSPMSSPGPGMANPFHSMQPNSGGMMPQQTGLSSVSPMSMTMQSQQQQQQQLGQAAFFGQSYGTSPSPSPNSAAHMFASQPQQQQQSVQMQAPGVNGFASSMMPSSFGQQGQYASQAYPQQQQNNPFGQRMW